MSEVKLLSHKPILFSRDNLVHAFSGATGSVVAMTLFYPLEVLRIRLQVDDRRDFVHVLSLAAEVLSEEGWSCFYKGIRPMLVSLYCSNFIYFYTFHGLKLLVRKRGLAHSAPLDLLLASLAGIVNVVTTTPLWLVTTRIKLQDARIRTSKGEIQARQQKYSGLIDGLIKVAREEGLLKLWSSIIPSIILVSNPAIQLMIYEAAKRRLHRAESSSLLVFLLSAFAKLVATVVTFPIQVGQARLRANPRNTNLFECLLDLVRTRGPLALYRGLEAKLLQTVLTSAFMFVVYEKIMSLLLKKRAL